MLSLNITKSKKTLNLISILNKENLEKEFHSFNMDFFLSKSPMLSLENNVPPNIKNKKIKKKKSI